MADKIKAIQPMITVGGKIEKPCYSITYYDTSDKMWHIGFGSFDLANVKKWLKEEFEVVAETADVAEVKHGEWIPVQYTYFGLKRYECSECRDDEYWQKRYLEHKEKYCPNCGAKMDGGKEE